MQVAQGNDTDSFACSCGSILGAYFAEGLPEHWYTQFNNTIHTIMAGFHETNLEAVIKRMHFCIAAYKTQYIKNMNFP